MTSLLISFVSLLVVGGATLAVLATIVWRRRSAGSGSELALMLVAAMTWVLAAAVEHVVPSLGAKIMTAKIQYVGILCLSPAAAVTVLRATGRGGWVPRYVAVTAPLAALGVITVFTNEWHGWIWRSVALDTSGALPLMTVEYGPGFSMINLVSHAQLTGAAVLFVQSSWRSWRPDATLVCVGFLAPWVANIVYQMRIGPWPNLDLTPLGLVVTGVSFTVSFHRVGRVFSTLKLAHRDVLEHIADLIIVFDKTDRVLSANHAARRTLDLPPLPAPAARALSRHTPVLECLSDPGADERRDIALEIEGATRVFDMQSVPVGPQDSPDSGRVFVLRDVTERRTAERQHRMHREQLRQIIDLIPHPVYAKDASGRYLFVNEACASRYGVSAAKMVGRRIREMHTDPEEASRILANDLEIIEKQRPYTTEETLSNGTQTAYTFRTTKVPFVQGDSESPAVVGISIDITKERERERLLESLASTDSLTNLTNRRSFQEILARVIDSARQKDERAAVLFIDLDRFKMVNDIYGHLAGDEVLRQVATRVQESVRFDDSIWSSQNAPTDDSIISRFGGDEFIVLLPRVANPGSAATVARRLLQALDAPFEVGSDRLQLGGSIGIAIFPEDGNAAEVLLRHCDQALTSAKRSGRGKFEFFNRRIGAADERRHELEKGLRFALECEEFVMHYQPIREMDSARLVGAEALLRWNSPAFGSVSPEEFIPIVEDSGLIVPIGLYVIRSVCRQIALWQQQGLGVPRISINLSARQLVDPDSAADVSSILQETGISGNCIEFELTEGSILAQTPIVEKTLSSLRDLGATFALDDFGTGYSSLSHLRRFAFQRLKIDRSFVNGIGTSDDDEKLARSIVALAKHLELETVAEGVETEEQLEFLRDEGCDFAQGYLIGRPMPASEFQPLLDREKRDEEPDPSES